MLSNKKNKKNMIIVTGPTASGKTTIAVQLADKIRGEIVSADSRQVYRGMDIGTGKDLSEYIVNGKKIKYHLIDILDPNENYSVYDFQKDSIKSIEEIRKNNSVPIVCGGTGLYIESILLDYDFSEKPPPNQKLRDRLYDKNKNQLLEILHQLIGDSDKDSMLLETKKQIIRNIEIASNQNNNNGFKFKPMLDESLVFGIKIEREILRSRIKERLIQRIEEGMIEEVEGLLSDGLEMDRLDYFGLEYKYVGKLLRAEISKDRMIQELTTSIRRFAKRQRTWFRRMEKRGIKIHWIEHGDIDSMMQKINSQIDGY